MVYEIESRALTMDEMTVNAQYILDYLTAKGWTKNAVCGMLGNMQSESSINPARWQGDQIGNTSAGFGLVQWTPATKYLDWASANGYDYKSMTGNLERILYEVENGLQWYAPDMTFQEFTQSTDSPYNLGIKFISAYERPADPNQPARGTQAENWYSILTGGGSVTPEPSKQPIFHLWLSDALPWR
jgi:hypothetical protein